MLLGTCVGVVSNFAGDGIAGYQNGPGAAARFTRPTGVAVDASSVPCVCERGCLNHRVRMITPEGVVSTLAGSGLAGFGDGQGTVARFNQPMDIAVDTHGNGFVADNLNHRIRKITRVSICPSRSLYFPAQLNLRAIFALKSLR